MNRRVEKAVRMYKAAHMGKSSASSILEFLFNTGKGLALLGITASGIAGSLSGYTAAKVTQESNTDKENAKLSYGVGNLEASIGEQAQKLKASRIKPNTEQKTMRIG